ncbi:hypothetical protein BGZ67_000314 [Mortierella alpina]|nr:hypothetical protein BGZ67_000314 [Mortierella alpina]
MTFSQAHKALGLQRTFLRSSSSGSSCISVLHRRALRRSYTTNPTAVSTPATTPVKHQPVFKSTSAINQSQHSPQFKAQISQLPNVANRTPLYILLGVLGASFWAGSIAVAANHQRQGTSIVRGTMFNVKFDTKAQQLLGDNIDFTNPSWPWISGTVAHLKGRVDIEFQVKGDKAEGRVHFVAVRPAKQWVTTDFTLTMPDGTCVVLGEHTVLPELDDHRHNNSKLATIAPGRIIFRSKHINYTQKYADKLKRKAQEEGVGTIEELKAKVLPITQTAFKPVRLQGSSSTAATGNGAAEGQVQGQPSKESSNVPESSSPSLDKIMKLDLVKDLNTEEISKVWIQKHLDKEDTVSAVIPAETYRKILTRSKEYPMFILPLSHGDAVEFYFLQFAYHQIVFTSLLEFQTHGSNARPFLTLTHYPELVDSKGIVLMHGAITTDPKMLTIEQAQILIFGLQQYYVSDHKEKVQLLQDFHKRPEKFSHEKLMELTEISG